MTTTEIVITDWTATPEILKVRVVLPALPDIAAFYYHRVGPVSTSRAWYTYAGDKPEDSFQQLMDELVLNHPILKNLASGYDLGSVRFDLILTKANRDKGYTQTIKEMRFTLYDAKRAVDEASWRLQTATTDLLLPTLRRRS